MDFVERRRLGRQLHYSTAALIEAVGIALNQLTETDNPQIVALVRECDEAIREISARIGALEAGDG